MVCLDVIEKPHRVGLGSLGLSSHEKERSLLVKWLYVCEYWVRVNSCTQFEIPGSFRMRSYGWWVFSLCSLLNAKYYFIPLCKIAVSPWFLRCSVIIQGDSVARGPKLLSIKNYVIEIMTWKFIYTYRERCKTGPAYNRCWNWSLFTSKHTWIRFSKFWNIFPNLFGTSSERITLYKGRMFVYFNNSLERTNIISGQHTDFWMLKLPYIQLLMGYQGLVYLLSVITQAEQDKAGV